MRNFLSLVVMLAAALAVAAGQTTPSGFTSVEVVGWDFSALDEKVREAVSKASAPGAGEAERRAAAEALSRRADFLWNAGDPRFYRHALGDYRHVLRFRPDDAEARERADTIVSIYKSMRRPVPTNGEAKPGEGLLVELFKTTPKRLTFGRGVKSAEGEKVSDGAAFVYQFDALAGQALSVSVGTKNGGAAVFDLLLRDPRAPRKLLSGARARRLILPAAGSYLIRVYSKGGGAEYELKAELK